MEVLSNYIRNQLRILEQFGLPVDDIHSYDDGFFPWLEEKYGINIVVKKQYSFYRGYVYHNDYCAIYMDDLQFYNLHEKLSIKLANFIFNSETKSVASLLKQCPANTPLYLKDFGYCFLDCVVDNSKHGPDTIYVKCPIDENNGTYRILSRYGTKIKGECTVSMFDEIVLLPSKLQDNWDKFDVELYQAADKMLKLEYNTHNQDVKDIKDI